MGEGTQKLTVEAQAKGFDKTAAEVSKVAEAEERLEGQTTGAAKATDAASEAAQKLNASESDYVEILRQVNPALGNLADSLLKGGRVAGDLASQNINLAGAFGKATEAIKNNAGALKLIGAGGAVVLGIYAITQAVKAMREEHERATEAIKRHREALNELKQEEADQKQTIEDIADRRRRGGFGADEAQQAVQTAEAIGKQFEALKPENINQVVAMLGDLNLSREQMTQAAVLQQLGQLQLDPGMSAETMRRYFDVALRRNAEQVETFLTRERTQGQGFGLGGERASEARTEAAAEGGSTLQLEKVIREALGPGAAAEDVKRMVELVGQFGTKGGLEAGIQEATGISGVLLRPLSALLEAVRGLTPVIPVEQQGDFFQRPVALTGPDLADLRKVLEALAVKVDANTRAVERATEEQDREEPKTVNNLQFSKHTYPDARAKRAATVNGENRRDQREAG